MKNAISFVIPAYNSAATLKDAVESIFTTNYGPYDEVIIVNDASTDKTHELIDSLKQKYPIHDIQNPKNIGCPATRNVGIRAAKNELIFNLDSDDILAAYSVSKLKSYLIAMNADVAAFSQIHFFRETPKKITHKWICPTGIYSLADYLSGPISPGGNYIYTKASWERIGGYWEYGKGLHEYWGYGLKQIASGSRFVAMPNSFYFHRYGRPSLFNREFSEQESNLLASKMITPFLHLLEEGEASYISSYNGSRTWFTKFQATPIRVKNCGIGRKGFVSHMPVWYLKRFIHICVMTTKQLIGLR